MLFRICASTVVTLSAVALIVMLSTTMPKGSSLNDPGSGAVLAMSSNAQPEPAVITLRRRDETLTRNVPSKGLHSYRIPLTTGQYLRVTARQSDMNSELALYDPSGGLLTQVRCRSRGATPISVIAELSGDYRLDLRSLFESTANEAYELHVADIRSAKPKDKERIAAERSCASADQLLNESRSESSRLAISKYEEALSYWKAAGDLREEANALLSVGSIHQLLGELHQSLACYNQALRLDRKSHDRWSESEVLNEIAYVYSILCENDKALSVGVQALRLSQATGNRHATARALNNVGDANYNFGKLKISLEHYHKALSLWRELNDRRGQALALVNLGYDY